MERETLAAYKVYHIFALLEDSLKDEKTIGSIFLTNAKEVCLKTAKMAFLPIICPNSLTS